MCERPFFLNVDTESDRLSPLDNSRSFRWFFKPSSLREEFHRKSAVSISHSNISPAQLGHITTNAAHDLPASLDSPHPSTSTYALEWCDRSQFSHDIAEQTRPKRKNMT